MWSLLPQTKTALRTVLVCWRHRPPLLPPFTLFQFTALLPASHSTLPCSICVNLILGGPAEVDRGVYDVVECLCALLTKWRRDRNWPDPWCPLIIIIFHHVMISGWADNRWFDLIVTRGHVIWNSLIHARDWFCLHFPNQMKNISVWGF